MNKNLRKAMISTICLLIVGVMSLTGVTYAWFTTSNTATVSNVNVTVASAGGGVELSKNGVDGWGFALDMGINETDYQPASTVKALDASGKPTFYTATVKEGTTDIITTVADTNLDNVVSFDVYLRNRTEDEVVVRIADTIFESAKGAGAARFAIVNHSLTTKTFDIFGATAETPYYGVKAAGTEFNWQTGTEYLDTVTVSDKATYTITVPNTAGSNIVKLTVYVWLEGNDTDCDFTLGGSAMSLDLKFTKQ